MKNKLILLIAILMLLLSTSVVFADNLEETADIYYEVELLDFKGIPARYTDDVINPYWELDVFIPIRDISKEFKNISAYSNRYFAVVNVKEKGNFYFFKDAEYYYYRNNKYYYGDARNPVASDADRTPIGTLSSHNTFGKYILSKNNQLYLPHKLLMYIADKKYATEEGDVLKIQGDHQYHENGFYFLTREIKTEKDKERLIEEYNLEKYMNGSNLPGYFDLRHYTKYKPSNDVLYYISTYFDSHEAMKDRQLENIQRGNESKRYFYDLAQAEENLYPKIDMQGREEVVDFSQVKEWELMALYSTKPEMNFKFKHIPNRDPNHFLLDDYPEDYLEFYFGFYQMSPKQFLYSKTILKQIFPTSYEEVHNRLAGLYYEQDNAFEKYKKYTYDGKTFWITNPYFGNHNTEKNAFSLAIAENNNFDYLEYINQKNTPEYH